MRELSTLHTKRLMVNFEADESQQERDIDIKTQEITELFRHAETLLKKFKKQGEDENISTSERAVRKNMQSSVAKKLQGLSMAFRSTQKEYLSRLRIQKSGGQAFDFLSFDINSAGAGGAGDLDMSDTDRGFTAAQLQEVDDTVEVSTFYFALIQPSIISSSLFRFGCRL